MSNGARAPSSPRTRRSYAKVGETRGGPWLAPSPFAPSRSSSQGGPHPSGRCPSPATLQSSATASGREREVLLIGGSGSRPRWGGVQESEAMRRGRAMCTLEKLQAWLDVGPFGNSSREEETMQSGWGRGGGCPVLFYSKTGGGIRAAERIDARVQRKIESGSQKCRWYASWGSSGGPPRKRVPDRFSGGHLQFRFGHGPCVVVHPQAVCWIYCVGEEQEEETGWKMERRRSFRCVCLQGQVQQRGPPSV